MRTIAELLRLALAAVQDGIDAAAAAISAPDAGTDGGVSECAVWVAAGTYLPTTDPTGDPVPGDERTKTFQLKAGVAQYGGFGGDEASCVERDISANETILSGDIGTAGDDSDNSYHVVTGAENATIDGFTITSGHADGVGSTTDGAGMYNFGSSPTVASCAFSGNSADGDGGGMFNYISASPDLTNCTFSGNTAADSGGALAVVDTSPALTNCILWGDTASTDAEIYDGGDSPMVMFSDVQGGYVGFGNISSDPLFVSTTDLHLQSTSPCVDTGGTALIPENGADLDEDGDVLEDIPFDLDGNPRVVGDAVDMGAYEYQP